MPLGLSKLFVALILTVCIFQPSQAGDSGFVFNARSSQVGSNWENNLFAKEETQLSWQLGLDSRFLSKQLKTNAGFTYRDDIINGHGGYETSVSWKLQELTLTSKFSNSWSNQAGKFLQPGVSDKRYVIETSYDMSASPYSAVFLSYGTGSRQLQQLPAQGQVSKYAEALTDLQAKLKFSYEILSFSLGAGQSRLLNDDLGFEIHKENSLFINGKLFHEYPVSLLPSFRLNYKTETAAGFTRNLENIETGLGLIYEPVQSPYRLSVKTAYENFLLPATNEEKDVLKFAASIDWTPRQHLNDRSSAWSLDYELKDIRDNINPNARTSDWSISLIWRMPIG